jgi:hypothetical protein
MIASMEHLSRNAIVALAVFLALSCSGPQDSERGASRGTDARVAPPPAPGRPAADAGVAVPPIEPQESPAVEALAAPAGPVADAGVAVPPVEPQASPAVDATITEAKSLCVSGWETFQVKDFCTAQDRLREGIAKLEPLGLSLTPKRGGDILASCLYSLGRVFETRFNTQNGYTGQTEEEGGPAALYARSLALRPNAEVRSRHRKLLANRVEKNCRLGKIERTVSQAASYRSWAAMCKAFVADAVKEFEVKPPRRGHMTDVWKVGGAPLEGDYRPSGPPDGPAAVTAVLENSEGTPFQFRHLVVPRAGGGWLGGEALPWVCERDRCPADVGAWMVSEAPVHAIVLSANSDWIFDELADGGPCDPTVDRFCDSGCSSMSYMVDHVFIDPKSGRTVTISVEVEGFDKFNLFYPPQALVAVEPLGGYLVLEGCGTRRPMEP